MDYRHHPFDVITGGLLGVITAWASYRQYFPPLSEPWKKGRAFPIRTWGHQPEPPQSSMYVSGIQQPGAEPLRERSWKAGDEEQGLPTPGLVRGEGSRVAGINEDDDEHNGNVFRQQMSALHKQRQATNPGYAPNPYGNQDPSALVAPLRVPSGRAGGRNDGYWSSSSEEIDGEHIELQQQYTLSNPSGPHDPLDDVETGYHPGIVQRGKSFKTQSTGPTNTGAAPAMQVPTVSVEEPRSSTEGPQLHRKPIEPAPPV